MRAVKEQCQKRVGEVKQQVSRDKLEFKQLLELRKKYQLTSLSKDPLLALSKQSQQSLPLDRLFVINLEF